MAKSRSGREFISDDNFINVVKAGYYIDKTLMIRDLLDNYRYHRGMLFTSPRKFGKTLNLSMIQTFFEKTDEDTSVYFKDLKIWKCGEKYTSEQGKYPVIHVDFSGLLGETWADVYEEIKTRVSAEYKRHESEVSSLSEFYARRFKDVAEGCAEEVDYVFSLRNLSMMLYDCFHVKPVILVDEYDAPVQRGYEMGFYEEATDFMTPFYSSALKGSDLKITMGVLTGLTRMARDSSFDSLNTIVVYSVLDYKYGPYYGFTEEEVGNMLKDFGHPEKIHEVREWYGGYHLGKEIVVFNPWSVAMYVMNDFTPASYWADVTDDSIINDVLSEDGNVLEIRKLMRGEEISLPMRDAHGYLRFYKKGYDGFWYLITTGYLTGIIENFSGDIWCTITIPNLETMFAFEQRIGDDGRCT